MARQEEGFTLIEMLVAIVVIGLGLMALASVAITSLRSIRISRERQDAVQIASSVIEDVRSYDYDRIAMPTTYSGPGTVTTVAGTETVHTDTDGQVEHTWTSSDGHRVTTIVTRPTAGGRRVTTTVAWDDRGETKVVTEETLIAEARRGLPVPNFQLSPETASRDGVLGETICFDHTLTNLGEQDSYSWQLLRPDGSGGWTPATFEQRSVIEDGNTATRQGFKVPASSGPGQGWFAWARMGSSSVNPMVDVSSDNRPDSANPVARRADNVLRVCYTAKNATGTINSNHDQSASFMVRVHSAFDETVLREVVDTLTVITSQQRLYLHHVYTDNGANAGTPVAPNKHNYKLVMDATDPSQTSSTVNFESGVNNGDPYPGLKVPAGTTVSFDFQNIESTARTITAADALIRLYAATQTSMTSTVGPVPVSLDVSLAKFVASNGNSTTESPLTATVTMAGSVNPGSFAPLSATVPMTGTTLQPNEYLRLKVTCPATEVGGCHLAYDVSGIYPADVVVTFQ